ncbi:MAG: 4-hydroxybenzoate octaprenyltransferase [Nitrospirae bacterium]|nr:MAG: 4-hydroxybenzoate octaprenyltransferase [Nitrospirota bacterium]
MITSNVVLYLRMIKFSHSVFALPFAFTGAILASGGIPAWQQLLWIAVAMVGARSGAMGANRLFDRHIDVANPRTAMREIPAGKIRAGNVAMFMVLSFGVMFFAAAQLNTLCLFLSPIAVGILVLYSFTKRFTWLSHFVLGIAIAGAPLGAWIAVTGSFSWSVVPLCLAVVFWLAGFDVLYALQDIDFDRRFGLHSIPQRFGVRNSLYISRCCHCVTFMLLLYSGIYFELNDAYWLGMIAVGGLLLYEHSLIKPDDLSKLDLAFFNMNGYISVTVFVFTLIDILI